MTAPVKYFDSRWRLTRAGVVNVWHYLDNEFAISGGRLILRGSNGSGKSRALEMLLPFLLDAERRRMDATGAQKVSLDELMKTGARGQTNRIGYLWLELERPEGFLTVGAFVRYSASAHKCEVKYFTTELRVGAELPLLNANREPLPRDQLAEKIGVHNLSDAEQHRETIRTKVFGLHGEAGRDRFTGLMQLLHTLRSPDVGNRIDEGKLPQILSDALPPLSEQILESAGEQLDSLTETRLAQERLTTTLEHVRRFHGIYRSYAIGALVDNAKALDEAALCAAQASKSVAELTASIESLDADLGAERARSDELRNTVDELANSIAGLRLAPLFQQADDLAQREKSVLALAGSARQALDTGRRARSDENDAASRAAAGYAVLRAAVDELASALGSAVDNLTECRLPVGDLPPSVVSVEHAEPTESEPVMDTLDQTPQLYARPSVVTVTPEPAEFGSLQDAAQRCRAAADTRRTQAEHRRREALRLEGSKAQVLTLERQAELKLEAAQDDSTAAHQEAAARDEVAIALNQRWREWLRSLETAQLLPDLDPIQPPLDRLHADLEALCGDAPDTDPLLDELDGLPGELARPATDRLAASVAAFDHADRLDRETIATLQEEQEQLEQAHDPTPPLAPWQYRHDGTPLWRAIDFRPEFPEQQRAQVEAALLASGLLTATIDGTGELRDTSGDVVLAPLDLPIATSLGTVLMPDVTSHVDDDVVDRILAGIGWEDPHAVTSVSADGHWRNGALSGHHDQPSARHIGATARATARRERLASIAVEVERLELAITQRDSERAQLHRHRSQIAAQVRTAPKSRELATARAAAAKALLRADTSSAAARTATAAATSARTAWSAENRAHEEICDGMALPFAAEDLLDVTQRCGAAVSACDAVDRTSSKAAECVERAASTDRQYRTAVARRRTDELAAEARRQEWAALATEVAAQREAVALPLKELEDNLRASEAEHAKTKSNLAKADARVVSLSTDLAGRQSTLTALSSEQDRLARELRTTGEVFNARLRLPGLRVAATDLVFDTLDNPADSATARRTARRVLEELGSRKTSSVNQLNSALDKFGAEVSGQLEVFRIVEHDVYLVHIEGAEQHHDSASVLQFLETKVEQGRNALTQREREVFTGFVLGGVATELRSRIQQADTLVRAMNDSLIGTRTSHGIGVKIGWQLTSQDAQQKQLLSLVNLADPVRSDQSDDELVTLVRNRVEHLHTADPSASYATHLREALDYRAWHTIEVTIIGPGPDQTRRISRRAKISQGETRFVSYVALFAAADGYLSGLPDADRALRLVLLDDAFAKVDERAIGELMGLLVRLDIDFVMTGHALWGTVAEVPALDIYEIRRIGDSSVVPIHIHWDGKNKTFLRSVSAT